MIIRVEEIPDVYVDGERLPSYMGVYIEEVEDYSLIDVLYAPTRIRHPQRFETWLTKLVCRNGQPWKYIRVCRLCGVAIRVEYEGRVLHFNA